MISYAESATATTFRLLLVDSVWVLGLIGAAAFFPVPTLNALVMAEVAQRAPEAIFGRANSATVQLLTLFNPIAPALAGLALEVFGTVTTLVSYGVALAFLAILVTTSRTVRAGPPD